MYCFVIYCRTRLAGLWSTLKAMSREIVSSEREPLLSVIPDNNESDSNDIHSANLRTVDHPSDEAEITCTPVVDSHLQVFKRRWYILILFSLANVIQSTIWNTWGPLAQSAHIAFGWSLGEIALLTNWGCVMFVSSTVFLSWLMDVKGMLHFFLLCWLSGITLLS